MEKYGMGEQLKQEEIYSNFKENILEPNKEVDVFMHSWSKMHEKCYLILGLMLSIPPILS